MKSKAPKVTVVFGAILFLVNAIELFGGTFPQKDNESHGQRQMSDQGYAEKVQFQDRYHRFRTAGNRERDKGNYAKAIAYQEEALKMAHGSSLEGVSRGELSRLYEQVGEYEKALNQVIWILENADQSSPLYTKYIETKARLIKKLKEQKEWESKQTPVVVGAKNAFQKASQEEQKRFLESLGGKGVWDVFKDAMVAEHGEDYVKARGIYESLLPQKENIEKEMGIAGWVMLYPAIQRTSELIGDEKREKEALAWIGPNLLDPTGEYHQYLSKLMPEVQRHLKERVMKYQP